MIIFPIDSFQLSMDLHLHDLENLPHVLKALTSCLRFGIRDGALESQLERTLKDGLDTAELLDGKRSSLRQYREFFALEV